MHSWIWVTFPHRGITRSLSALAVVIQLVKVVYSTIYAYSRLFMSVHTLWEETGSALNYSQALPEVYLLNRVLTYVWSLSGLCSMLKQNPVLKCTLIQSNGHNVYLWSSSLWVLIGVQLLYIDMSGGIWSVVWCVWARHCFNHTARLELEEMCSSESRMWYAIKIQAPTANPLQLLTHTYTIKLAIHSTVVLAIVRKC